jgi:hypothetical protein
MCWAEEVELLEEEMHRVTCFLRWHAEWWNEKIWECALSVAACNEGLVAYKGLVAYTSRQGQLRQDLADCFERMWAVHLPSAPASTGIASSSSDVSVTACHFPDLHLPESVLYA